MYLEQYCSMKRVAEYIDSVVSEMTDAQEFAEWCVEQGVFDYTTLRNIAIREYYKALPHKSRYEAKMVTADHFCLSEAQIHRILFDKRYKKSNSR